MSQFIPRKAGPQDDDTISLMDVFCILFPEPGQPLFLRATLPSRQRGFTESGLKGRRKSGATSASQLGCCKGAWHGCSQCADVLIAGREGLEV